MLLKTKNLIILQAVVFVSFPILSLIFDLYTIHNQPGPFTTAQYFKNQFLPFYNFIDDSIRIQGSLANVFPLSKINSHFYFFVMPILSIIGTIRFQRTGSLRVLRGLALLAFFVTLPFLSFAFFVKYTPSFFGITLAVIRFITCILLLIVSQSKINILTSDDGEAISQKLSTRFMNYILDQIVIIYLTLQTSGWFFSLFLADSGSYFTYSRSTIVFQITYVLVLLIYYFVAEGIFKTTFGKVVSHSTIVDSDGSFISVGNGLVRTLCRLIPFEAFSFLFGQRGWHDTISNTYVVKSAYVKEEPM